MSDGRLCPDCGSSDVVEDAHYSQEQLVCADCGFILTEGVLTTTQQEEGFLQAVRFSDSTGQNESISRYKLRGIMRVRNLCRVLRLPDNFADTAVTYYEQAFDHAMFHSVSVEKKEAIVGCCVYITCRQFHWPLTMGTISAMLYSKQELFNKMFSQLVQSLNLDVPLVGLQDMVQSHCKSFKLFQNSPSVLPEYAENFDKVLERTLQIVELASETWLVTGRHPIPIITVAAFLSWQSLRPAHRLSCKLTHFCRLCEVDKPSPTGERMREFVEIFLKLAQELPWLKMFTLNKKTVVQHLGDILRHRAYLLRKALAAAEGSHLASEDIAPSEQPIHTSPFLPPCVKKRKKRSYNRAFPEGKQVTGDEEILDSEIEQYLRTPMEIKEFQDAQAKFLNH